MKKVILLLLIISQGALANCWDKAARYYHVDPYLLYAIAGNDSNLLIVFYVQIMPDDFVMQLHRF